VRGRCQRTQASTALSWSAVFRLAGRGRPSLHCLVFLMLATFLQLSFERVLGLWPGSGKSLSAHVHQGSALRVPEVVSHGVVAGLGAVVGLLGTFSHDRHHCEVVADTFFAWQAFEMCASIMNDYRLGTRKGPAAAMSCLFVCILQVL